jgi:hypothetical protein
MTTTILCEHCEKNEATEIIEVPFDYSHWDGSVYSYDEHVCKKCFEEQND